MRKLKLQVQVTMDGFMAGTNGEMDWMTFNWSDDLNEYVTRLTEPVDTILLGRNLAQGFIPHWTAAFNNPETAEDARKMAETPKVVFSRTLTKSEWENTRIADRELAAEVNALKKQPGSDMIAYGGSMFVSSLLKDNLIDELHLFVNPATIGKGMRVFPEATGNQNFKLVSSRQFECGIVVLTYHPA